MEWFINNFGLLVGLLAFVICAVWGIVYFFRMSRDSQIGKIKEWLIYACSVAEKELGSGTGQLKLRYVYDMFLSKAGWLRYLITFEQFSEMVDEALVTVNKVLSKRTIY